jgi:hypothetical protein
VNIARVGAYALMALAVARVEAQELPTSLSVTVDKGRLTCKVRTAALSHVLDALSEQTGVTFVAADTVRGEDVSLELVDVPVEQGMRRLLRSYDTFFFYGAGGDGRGSLRAVWVYQRGAGVALHPVPQEPSVTADDQRRAADADPHVREAAYTELMSRGDAASRELVLNAVRGVSEPDNEVRARLLAHALNQGIELPRELLVDLVRADGSDTMRLLALDALTGDPAAPQAAAAAADDPSAMVRDRARQILEAQAAQRRPPP